MPDGTRVVAVGTSETVLGLGLLGIEGFEVGTSEEARAVLERLLETSGTALVLVDETLGEGITTYLEASGAEAGQTLVVEIPAAGRGPLEDSLRRRVARALGFETGG